MGTVSCIRSVPKVGFKFSLANEAVGGHSSVQRGVLGRAQRNWSREWHLIIKLRDIARSADRRVVPYFFQKIFSLVALAGHEMASPLRASNPINAVTWSFTHIDVKSISPWTLPVSFPNWKTTRENEAPVRAVEKTETAKFSLPSSHESGSAGMIDVGCIRDVPKLFRYPSPADFLTNLAVNLCDEQLH